VEEHITSNFRVKEDKGETSMKQVASRGHSSPAYKAGFAGIVGSKEPLPQKRV
jgi:hypothetical protein